MLTDLVAQVCKALSLFLVKQSAWLEKVKVKEYPALLRFQFS